MHYTVSDINRRVTMRDILGELKEMITFHWLGYQVLHILTWSVASVIKGSRKELQVVETD